MKPAYVTRDDIEQHLSSEPIAPVLPRLPELIEEASAEVERYVTIKIGGAEYPMSGVNYERIEEPSYGPDVRAYLADKADFSASFTVNSFDAAAWRSLLPSTRLPTVAVTHALRDGSTQTEVFEEVKIAVRFVRRGLPRPGQWSGRARRKRARRLERAAQRRFGLSRRGLQYGFPYEPPRALAAIHEECRRAMVETDARLLEQTIGATLPEGVTMKIEPLEVPFSSAYHDIVEAMDLSIQLAILGKGGSHV